VPVVLDQDLSVQDLLYMILQEIRDQKIVSPSNKGRPKKLVD
jgi:hypothetical protein